MKRGITLLVALVLAGGLLVGGCDDDDDTTVALLTTDSFPGDTIQSNDVADDQRAMSINDQDVVDFECVRNGPDGGAIVLFVTNDGVDHLWASHWDGSTFTPPVELGGVDVDASSPVQASTAVVAFLNTGSFDLGTNDENSDVRARNRDAVILWRRSDDTSTDFDGGNDEPGRNVRLFFTYFDHSNRSNTSTTDTVRDGVGPEELRHGFTVVGRPLDTLDEGPQGADPAAEDVMSHGVVSDGLCGTGTWCQGDNDYEWADEVTHLVAAWSQIDDADDGGDGNVDEVDDGPPADEKLFSAVLDLTTGDFGAPAEVGLAGGQGSNTGNTRDELSFDKNVNPGPVDWCFWTDNNVLVNGYLDDPDGAGTTITGETIAAPSGGAVSDTLASPPVEPGPGAVVLVFDDDSSTGVGNRTEFQDNGDGTFARVSGPSGTAAIDYETGAIEVTGLDGALDGETDNFADYENNAAESQALAATTWAASATGASPSEAELSPARAGAYGEALSQITADHIWGTDCNFEEVFVLYAHDAAVVDRDTNDDGVIDDNDTGTDDEFDVTVSRIPADASSFVLADDTSPVSADRDPVDNNTTTTPALIAEQDVTRITAREDRTGEWIGLFWFRPTKESEDDDVEQALYGSIIRDGTAAFSQGSAGGLIHPETLISTQASGSFDRVDDAAFQLELGWCCGIQSLATRMNILFVQQSDATSSIDPDELQLLQLDVGGDETALTTAEELVSDQFGEDEFGGTLDGFVGVEAQAIDAGDAGEAFVVWRRDTSIAGGTTVTGEDAGTVGTPPGGSGTLSGTLDHPPIDPGSATFTIDDDGSGAATETVSDNGDGTLTGSANATGTINYVTGDYDIIGINTGSDGETDNFVDYTVRDPDGDRLFAAEVDASGSDVQGPVRIGSDEDLRDAVSLEQLVVAPKPTDCTGAFAAERIDVILREERGEGFDTVALRHRSYDARQANSSTVPFDERFTPDVATGLDPFEIDTHQTTVATPLDAATNGRTLGVYFDQDGHIYYNEFDGSSWIETNGVIDPQLVDNESSTDANFVEHCTRACACDLLPRGIIFFTKVDVDGDIRLHARVHN